MRTENETSINPTNKAINSVKEIFNARRYITRSEINKAVKDLSDTDQNIALSEINILLMEHNQKMEDLPE